MSTTNRTATRHEAAAARLAKTNPAHLSTEAAEELEAEVDWELYLAGLARAGRRDEYRAWTR
jgi:hypothetical protein